MLKLEFSTAEVKALHYERRVYSFLIFESGVPAIE
jgi:hypothetical protein